VCCETPVKEGRGEALLIRYEFVVDGDCTAQHEQITLIGLWDFIWFCLSAVITLQGWISVCVSDCDCAYD